MLAHASRNASRYDQQNLFACVWSILSIMKLSLLLAATVVMLGGLTSCGGISERECVNADWYTTGFNDGRKGYPLDKVELLSEACGEYDVAVDNAEYRDGHAGGIERYCQPQAIYNSAERGGQYYGVCSTNPHAGLLVEAWSQGRELYFFDQQIWQYERELDRIREDLYLACRFEKGCYRNYASTHHYNFYSDRLRFRIIDLRRDRDRLDRRLQARLREIERVIDTSDKAGE